MKTSTFMPRTINTRAVLAVPRTINTRAVLAVPRTINTRAVLAVAESGQAATDMVNTVSCEEELRFMCPPQSSVSPPSRHQSEVLLLSLFPFYVRAKSAHFPVGLTTHMTSGVVFESPSSSHPPKRR